MRPTSISLDPTARLDPGNAVRIARSLREAIAAEDAVLFRPLMRAMPGRPGVGAERLARSFVKIMGDRFVARRYDAERGVLTALLLTSSAPGRADAGAAVLAMGNLACCATALRLETSVGLLSVSDHACGRAIERLGLGGPRQVALAAPARWLPLLVRLADLGADLVLSLAGVRRPGLLVVERDHVRGFQAVTTIAPRPGSRDARLHAELESLLAGPPPRFGENGITDAHWASAQRVLDLANDRRQIMGIMKGIAEQEKKEGSSGARPVPSGAKS